MEISSYGINSNHVFGSASQKVEVQPQVAAVESNAPTGNSTPSAIVTISNQGLDLVRQAIAESRVDTYVEKTDEEYAKMSYEELIDERNGGKNVNHSLDMPNAVGFRMNGKADQAAGFKLAEQTRENSITAMALQASIKKFKASVAKVDPKLAKSDFAISFIDGKAAIQSESLSKSDIAKLQKMLDDKSNSSSSMLKYDISKYNEAALTTINMMIYAEKGMYDGPNNPYEHRNDPMSMKEFTENINYESAASSNGGYTFQKHAEVIGSTGYGVKRVYKSGHAPV